MALAPAMRGEMGMQRRLISSLAAFACMISMPAQAAGGSSATAPTWDVVPLVPPAGFEGHAIATATVSGHTGLVVGEVAQGDEHTRAVAWRHGVPHLLAGASGSSSAMQGNDKNQVAGFDNEDGLYTALLWAADGSVTRLTPLWRGLPAFANALDDSGIVSGSAYTPYGNTVPVIWKQGVVSRLALPPKTVQGSVAFSSPKGYKVGVTSPQRKGFQGTIWTPSGVPAVISVPGATIVQASWVNDSGDVAGSYDLGDGIQHPFLQVSGQVQMLPLVQGDTGGQATGLNNAGVAVGMSAVYVDKVPTHPHGVIWKSGVAHELSALLSATSRQAGWTVTDGTRIDERNRITALASLNGAPEVSVVLVPAAAE